MECAIPMLPPPPSPRCMVQQHLRFSFVNNFAFGHTETHCSCPPAARGPKGLAR